MQRLVGRPVKGYVCCGGRTGVVADPMGVCKYGTQFPPGIYWEELLAGLNAVSGYGMTVADLRKVGERICNLRRFFNVREGVGISDFAPPQRFLSEPVPSDPAEGRVLDLSTILCKYIEHGMGSRGRPDR